jgi:hypothetical protein
METVRNFWFISDMLNVVRIKLGNKFFPEINNKSFQLSYQSVWRQQLNYQAITNKKICFIQQITQKKDDNNNNNNNNLYVKYYQCQLTK